MHILCPACELISKIDDSKIVKPPIRTTEQGVEVYQKGATDGLVPLLKYLLRYCYLVRSNLQPFLHWKTVYIAFPVYAFATLMR